MDVLSTLTPREEKVLKLRFGIEDGRTRTLEEVGKEFNVTRERIRQIEAKALRKKHRQALSRMGQRLLSLLISVTTESPGSPSESPGRTAPPWRSPRR